MLYAFVNGDATAKRENQDSDDEASEIDFLAMADGEVIIGRLFRLLHALKRQYLVAAVDPRVDTFRLHGGAAGDKGRAKFCDRNEGIADQRRDDDFGRA